MYWESRGRSVRIGNSFAEDNTQPQYTAKADTQRIQTFTKPLTRYRATHQCPLPADVSECCDISMLKLFRHSDSRTDRASTRFRISLPQ